MGGGQVPRGLVDFAFDNSLHCNLRERYLQPYLGMLGRVLAGHSCVLVICGSDAEAEVLCPPRSIKNGTAKQVDSSVSDCVLPS